MTSWRGGGGFDSWSYKNYDINTPPRAQHTSTYRQHWDESPSPQGTKHHDHDLPSTSSQTTNILTASNSLASRFHTTSQQQHGVRNTNWLADLLT